MDGQMDLFGGKPRERAPYQAHSPESRDAAAEIEPHLGRLQAEVLELIRDAGPRGMTDAELVGASGRQGSTIRPRRVELFEKSLIVRRGKRQTASGRWAAVWVAT